MELEELMGQYEITALDTKKLHHDLSLYYSMSNNPKLSPATEKKFLDDFQFEICKSYEINYSTFLRNLRLLEKYQQSSGGRN